MIAFRDVSKNYNSHAALADISFEISPSEFIFLVGPSGAGKSTLLKLIIRDDTPSKGNIFVDGMDIAALRSHEVPHLRRKVGTVFQDFKLLPQRTVYENVSFPLEIMGLDDSEISDTVMETLKLVNLEEKAGHFPSQLSGGESQRTSIARAMVLRPEILLADEPTGNLDPQSAWEVMQILTKLNTLGSTIVMATHNTDITSSLPHRRIEIKSGKIVEDTKKAGDRETNKEKKSEKTKEE